MQSLPPSVRSLAVVLALAGAISPVLAQDSPLRLQLGQGLTYDSNLFRLNSASTLQPYGKSERSEIYATTRVGALFETESGLQRFRATAGASPTFFWRFGELDHVGYDVNASWLWRVGRNWDGEIRGLQTQTLTSYRDYRPDASASNGDRRSMTTTRDLGASANFWFLPDASIGAGVGNMAYQYSSSLLKAGELSQNYADLVARYRPPTGSDIEFRYRHATGEFNREADPTLNLYRNYTQDDYSISSGWQITAASRVSGSVGYTERKPEGVSVGAFRGVTGRVAYDWKITAATAVNFGVGRAVQAIAGIGTDYAVVQSYLVSPSWEITSRVRATASYEQLDREIRGTAGYKDRITIGGLGALYKPTERLETSLRLTREQRDVRGDASLELLSYRANVLFMQARYTLF